MKKTLLSLVFAFIAAQAETGYLIFEHKPTATENYATAYKAVAANQYPYGYCYPTPCTNYSNPSNANGVIWVNEGVIKYNDAVHPAAPSAPNYISNGAAIGIKNNPATAAAVPNMSDCTSGFSYYYKGAKHSFQLEFDPTVCGTTASDGSNKWGVASIDASAVWKKHTIEYSDLELINTWTGTSPSNCQTTNEAHSTVDLIKVSQMAWEMGNKLTPSTTTSLMIASVVCLNLTGETLTVAEPSASITNTIPVPSSSSAGGGSSSSIGGVSSSGGNNSSSSGEGVSSSDSGFGGSSSSIGNISGFYCKMPPPSSQCALIAANSTITSVDQCLFFNGCIMPDCTQECTTPILGISSTIGLTVAQYARSLQISSAKEAKVQLFDMRGERVMNISIPAGQSTVNLENQKLGVYYAVISSGSNKQTVKVVVR